MTLPWPFGHIGLKAVSVAIAVALWVAVAGEETVERGFRVPIELQQFPAGLELLGEPPTLVDVRVRGTSGTLARTLPSDIVAVIDLRGARAGRRLYQLTPEQVRAPFGVDVIQVMPASMALDFEASASRKVPVVPSIEGDPAPGFIIGPATSEPPDVEIVGPQSAVDAAKEAVTEAVAVSAATAPVTRTVPVGMLNPTLRVRSPRVVSVTVPIVPGPRERTFRDQPVHLNGLTPGLSAQAVPPDVLVVVRGSREGVGRIGAADVVAAVDLTGLGPGDYSLPVRVDAVGAAGVVRVDPATVQVSIVDGKRR